MYVVYVMHFSKTFEDAPDGPYTVAYIPFLSFSVAFLFSSMFASGSNLHPRMCAYYVSICKCLNQVAIGLWKYDKFKSIILLCTESYCPLCDLPNRIGLTQSKICVKGLVSFTQSKNNCSQLQLLLSVQKDKSSSEKVRRFRRSF